jgi:hypothetical protein
LPGEILSEAVDNITLENQQTSRRDVTTPLFEVSNRKKDFL